MKKNTVRKNYKLVLVILIVALLGSGKYGGSFWDDAKERQIVFAADNADDLEDDIKDLEKKKKKELEKMERYEGDVDRLEGQVYSTQKDINVTAEKIETTEETIERKEKDIENLNKNIEFKKVALRRMLQQVYYNSDQPFLYLFLEKNSFFESVTSIDSFLNIKRKVLSMLDEISQAKKGIKKEQEELEKKKEEHEELLWVKEAQKSSLVSEKQKFEQKVEKKKLSVAEINGKINKLRSNLNRILGKSYDTGEIKDAIKFANKVTGVRKGFLFGMLSYESGGNPDAGNCTIKNCSMSSARKDYFEKICDDLGLSNTKCKKKPLSCASPDYPGSGGAMGAAQFMPDTWWGYKDDIATATGSDPPNPWDLLDGVVAMALKLENDGATNDGKISIKVPYAPKTDSRCNGKSVKVDWEIYASMRYLGWTCYGYTNYAPGVQALADGYDNL